MEHAGYFASSVVNLIGWLGLLLIISSFRFKNRITIGGLLAITTVAMTAHYIGKEAWAVASVAGTMIFGHLCGAFAERFRRLQSAKFVLIPILWGLSLSIYSSWIDIIPALEVTIEVACLT